MTKLRVLILAVGLCLLAPESQAGHGYMPVSLIKLLVVPEKYVDQKIRVRGFFETGIYSAIYINHISAEIMDATSAIPVIDKTLEGELTLFCNKRYVVIEGRLTVFQNRYEITDVTEVLDIESLKPCWEQKHK